VKRSEPDFLSILKRLARHGVDFIVVGGVGAAFQGAPIATFDLDVVHSREPANIDRILAALKSLGAVYRSPAVNTIRPDRSHLASSGHQLLMTRFGPLDLLGVIGSGSDYGSLLPDSEWVEASPKIKVRVLRLHAIIKSKEEVGGEKDQAVLSILRRTLEEQSRK
jgi:hypothetical protein